MKSAFLSFLSIAVIAGCTISQKIEFTGTAPAIKSGAFLVREGNNTLYSSSIKNGTFKAEGILERSGYYDVAIMDNVNTAKAHDPYEIYLEPGKYTITANTDLDKYPIVVSDSKIQQDLSAYYAIREQSVKIADDLVKGLETEMHSHKLTPAEYLNNTARLENAYERRHQTRLDAFRTFIRERPNSIIAAHLMESVDYEEDPEAYNAIFQKLSDAAKNTEEGKIISEKLSSLLKLRAGSDAPAIAGTTPNGKSFNKAALDKKVYIIDFWRAANEVSRLNHEDLRKMMLDQLDKQKVGIISISLDSKRDWWTTAIKQDAITWPQYSDLKGNDSANAQNWLITTIPTYYLVDGNWRIIMRDVNLTRIPFEVSEYLKKLHRNNAVLQHAKNIIRGQVPYGHAPGKFTERG